MDGLLIVNKPAGMTSHDVVARVRRLLNERSVGHLGTLDPSATGVLPLLIGRFTRLAAFYNDADKQYEGMIHFGQATDTYDAEGEPVGLRQAVSFSLAELREAAQNFVGFIQQMPPPFSAKKIAGVPAYKLARKKEKVDLQPRKVKVKQFEILGFDGERARFRACVGSGTYMRSIAHDLGKALGPGAYLGELTRTAVREFVLDGAHRLDELESSLTLHNTSYQTLDGGEGGRSGRGSECNASTAGVTSSDLALAPMSRPPSLEEMFIHPRLILPEFPAVTAPPDALAKVHHGAAVNLPYFPQPGVPSAHGPVMLRVFADQTRLVAIARQIAGTLFHPKVVLM